MINVHVLSCGCVNCSCINCENYSRAIIFSLIVMNAAYTVDVKKSSPVRSVLRDARSMKTGCERQLNDNRMGVERARTEPAVPFHSVPFCSICSSVPFRCVSLPAPFLSFRSVAFFSQFFPFRLQTCSYCIFVTCNTRACTV